MDSPPLLNPKALEFPVSGYSPHGGGARRLRKDGQETDESPSHWGYRGSRMPGT